MNITTAQQKYQSDSFYPSNLSTEIFCADQKIRATFKREQTNGIVERLRQSQNKTALACAMRLERCASPQNVFVADDFHTKDGEAYSANGNLWSCSSLLCQNCTGKLARNNRKTIRHVVKNEKLFIGENWYFITLTMPNLLLKDYSLDFITLVFQKAFEAFTHRNNDARKRTQYQKLIRGLFKNAEFTYTENSTFHFHAHLLAIAKSKIQRDNFSLIRTLWTNALERAFEFYSIPFELNTSDNLAVVNVQKVNFANREKTIQELCKYVTKSDSWQNIPLEEIEKIIERPRRVRMFEALGACRESAKKMRERLTKARANQNKEFLAEYRKARANIEVETYLDTKELTPRKVKQRRASWRVRIKEMSLDEYKKELDTEVLQVQEYRRRQLSRSYPAATFETLDGRRWSAVEHSDSRKFQVTTLAHTDEGAWFSKRIPSRQSRGVLEMLRQLERAPASQPTPSDDDALPRTPSIAINSPYPLLNDAPTLKATRLSNWQLFDSFCDL
jgi:hypothetical protein